MSWQWLKQYMPRGLYGRAALILVLPFVVLLLIVSVAFIQRHLEDVSTQMTETVSRELRLILIEMAAADSKEAALLAVAPEMETLRMRVAFVDEDAVPAEDWRRFYDYSGLIITDFLHNRFANLISVQLIRKAPVALYFRTNMGPIEIQLERRRLSASAPHQLLVIMLVTATIMVVIAFAYLRNQLRPITRLAAAAEAFGHGNTVPYSPRGAQEVRSAGTAFLDMRARIERHLEQRTLMLSGVSHDLRTPLTRLKLGLSMMDEAEAGPLIQDLDEMERMLDEFLNFAKVTSEGDPQSIDPIALVQHVVDASVRAGKTVTLIDAQGAGLMMLRPMALQRAVENLVGNAVRYGTRAELSVALTDRSLRIRVEDDGPGIPEDQRGEAIKPFTRLDPARNQNLGSGVGLGLAITADIARTHGGVLRLGKSDRLGGLQADIVIGR